MTTPEQQCVEHAYSLARQHENKRRQFLNDKLNKVPMGEKVTIFEFIRGWLIFCPEFWEAVEGYFKEKEGK